MAKLARIHKKRLNRISMPSRFLLLFFMMLALSSLGFAQAKSAAPAKSSGDGKASATKKEYALGFFSGVHLNKASTKTNGSTVNMKGSSFPIGGYFDGRINGKYGYQVTFANEPYMVEGNTDVASCGNSATHNCDININYFSLGPSVVYNIFQNDKAKGRAYGGMTFLFPQTKTSNVLDIGSQGIGYNIKIGASLDLSISETYYVPLDLGLNYFPNFFPNKNDYSTFGTTIHVGFGVYLN